MKTKLNHQPVLKTWVQRFWFKYFGIILLMFIVINLKQQHNPFIPHVVIIHPLSEAVLVTHEQVMELRNKTNCEDKFQTWEVGK